MQKYANIFICVVFSLFLNACGSNNSHQTNGYIETRLTYVSSQTNGALSEIYVSRGQSIKANSKLFKLDANPQSQIYQQAKAQLAASEANLANLEKGLRPTEIAAIKAQKEQIISQLDYAKVTYSRNASLFKKGFIQKSQLDLSLSNLKNLEAKLIEINENLKTAQLSARPDQIAVAEANVDSLKAAANKALWQLNQKIIFSPINGKIFDVYYRIGETILPNYPVVSIISPENTYAIFYVSEEQLHLINLNKAIGITCDACKNPIKARVSYISPQAEFTPPVIYSEENHSKLTFKVEAEFPKEYANDLHPGMPIQVNMKYN